MSKKDIDRKEQEETPFLDAYVEYVKSSPTPFDVPGHKLGSFETDLSRKISNLFAEYDANAPYGLDNLANPKSVIKKAEELTAKACHCDRVLFSVNGTTGGILAMFIGCLSKKDKVILPGNVHKSVINGLILSGAKPVFVSPEIDHERNIACGVSYENVVRAMDENPDAKAVFIIHPTYFGVVSDLKNIVKEAHKRNMIVMCDEAHGSNFYFSKELPISAMDAGADISSMSMHKGSGSLTQSSLVLVQGHLVDFYEVKKAMCMVTSTSPNSILLCSLDAARKEMALRGEEILHDDLLLSQYAREEINKIDGLHCYGKEYAKASKDSGRFGIDETKLVIDVTGLSLYGYEAYRLLRMDYNVQIELGETDVILALIAPGTTKAHIERLLEALRDLSKKHYKQHPRRKFPHYDYKYPVSRMDPREAYDADYEIINLKDSIGRVSSETVMAYPPGIPILIPGEEINKDTLSLMDFYYKEGGEVLKDTPVNKIKVVIENTENK